jgi:hypothetical protein
MLDVNVKTARDAARVQEDFAQRPQRKKAIHAEAPRMFFQAGRPHFPAAF